MSDYERGFADGFERGFKAGREGWNQPPVIVPTVISPDCGCPPGTVCNSTACPRRIFIGDSTTFTLPPGTSISYGMSEGGIG